MRDKFNDSFERLREQSNRLASVKRNAENYDELVAERIKLDELRSEVDEERKQIVSRHEYAAPDVVEPRRGRQDTRAFGKVAAAITVLLFVGVVAAIYVGGRSVLRGFPLNLADNVETVELDDTNRCRWTVVATVRNDASQSVEIYRLATVLDKQMRFGPGAQLATIPAGAQAPVTASWLVPATDDGVCPSPDEIDHGNLIIHYAPSSVSSVTSSSTNSVSRGF